MKVQIVLKEAKGILQRHKFTTHNRILKQKSENKKKQTKETVKFCVENGCRGYKALVTSKFPLTKDGKTKNARLDGNIDDTEMTYSNQRIPTKSEEDQLLLHSRTIKN